jgi:hypothetical protein
MFIPTGPVGFQRSNGDGEGTRFPPDWLVGVGAGISNWGPIGLSWPGGGGGVSGRARGGDGERPPAPPHPAPCDAPDF